MVRSGYTKHILDPLEACEPVSTEDLFFEGSTDDMLIYWSKDNDFKFSEEMQKRLDRIKEKYDSYVKSYTKPIYSVRGIFELIQRAQKGYPEFKIFEDFLNETIDSLDEMEIQLLWKHFEDFLNEFDKKEISDSEFKKTAKIFMAFVTNKALRRKILNAEF